MDHFDYVKHLGLQFLHVKCFKNEVWFDMIFKFHPHWVSIKNIYLDFIQEAKDGSMSPTLF